MSNEKKQQDTKQYPTPTKSRLYDVDNVSDKRVENQVKHKQDGRK